MKVPVDFSGRRSPLLRFIGPVAASLGSVAVATLVRMGLDLYLGNNQAYATYYVAVALIAWLLGWWPALVTMALGYVAGDWFFAVPRHALGIEDPGHLIDFLLYLLVTGTVVALITRLRRIQESLRRSEMQFRVTAETVPDILFAAGVNANWDYVSGRFHEYTGLSPDEAWGDGWTKALHPDDSERVRARWEMSVRTGESFEAEFRLRDAGGAYRWFMGRAQPVENDPHRAIRWAGCCTDIEAQKHAADLLKKEVDKRTTELRSTVQELEGLSYSLTHDMRAPLRAMVSYIELAEVGLDQSPDSKSLEYLRRIKVSARRMDSLILDALNYSMLLRNHLPLGSVEVATLLRGIVESYPEFQPPASEVTIEFDRLPVKGNEAALTQVFSNLMGNAVKFIGPGVKPRVHVKAEKRSTRGILENRNGGPEVARIWVEDNGMGIPERSQETIFGIFQTGHSPGAYPGTGIGLAIVRKAMERMGGRVGVESEQNQGSRFWIELPLASDA